MRKHLALAVIVLISCLQQKTFAQNVPPYLISHLSNASSGYYFLSSFRMGILPGSVYQNHMILDSVGRLVYYKSFPNGTNTGDFKLQSNGLISYSFQSKFFLMDSTFNVIDSVNCKNGITTDVHDFQILPNGHFLLLGIESVSMDLSAYTFGPNNIPGSANAIVKCGIIQELDVNKNVVFEWHAKDYFTFTDVDESFLNNPNQVDWTHCNAVEMDQDGNILLSSRHFNEITKINRQDSSIIWRMGGNANEFTFLNDSMQFKRQHDIRRLPNGNITLFDNGNGMNSSYFHFASGKEYQLNETTKTAELVWSYVDDSTEFSMAMGNFHRKVGGNSVIGYGMSDTQNKVLSAVDNSGNKVFQMEFVLPIQSYRVFNYDQLPWNFNRPVITCYYDNGQLYLDAGSGYNEYLWSTGDTTQTIQVSVNDTFFVFVSYGNGGLLSSEWLVVTDPVNFCNTTSLLDDNSESNISIVNPVRNELHILIEKPAVREYSILISDLSGKIIQKNNYVSAPQLILPVSELSPGVYFLSINNSVFKFIKLDD